MWTTVKAVTQERGMELETEIRYKCAGNKMNVHAHIVKAHIVIGSLIPRPHLRERVW